MITPPTDMKPDMKTNSKRADVREQALRVASGVARRPRWPRTLIGFVGAVALFGTSIDSEGPGVAEAQASAETAHQDTPERGKTTYLAPRTKGCMWGPPAPPVMPREVA